MNKKFNNNKSYGPNSWRSDCMDVFLPGLLRLEENKTIQTKEVDKKVLEIKVYRSQLLLFINLK